MLHLVMIVEKSKDMLFGRVQYEDDLIIDTARTIVGLERKFKKLLRDFHGLNSDDINFEFAYDLAALFDKFSYLNMTSLAQKAQMNPALLRQYASGVKYPSAKQAKKLEDTIHKIGKELSAVAVYAE